MPKRIQQRVGSRWWRSVEVSGRVTLAGGLTFIMYSLDAAIRTDENASGNVGKVLIGCAVLFLGFVMAAAARQSDTRWRCSQCSEQLGLKEDRACVGCQTILD